MNKRIRLSVTPDIQEQAKQQVQQMLQELKDELSLPIYWVHLEQEVVIDECNPSLDG
jgi:ribosome maturation protein Sdo1